MNLIYLHKKEIGLGRGLLFIELGQNRHKNKLFELAVLLETILKTLADKRSKALKVKDQYISFK
jgi:hypothetical protein